MTILRPVNTNSLVRQSGPEGASPDACAGEIRDDLTGDLFGRFH